MRLLLILLLTLNLLQAKKIALLIGNNDYSFQPLSNPLHDVDGIYNTLKEIGFDISKKDVLKNASQSQMQKALANFSQRAKSAEIALVYFSGHGMQVNNRNYMFPARTTATKPVDLFGLVDLDYFIQSASSAKYGIILVDACRNNPLVKYFQNGKHKGSVAKKGLGQVTPTVGQVVIGFATSAGDTADDGNGRMSPYAKALSVRLKEKDDIRNILGKVAKDVSSKYEQNPIYRANLAYAVYLKSILEPISFPHGGIKSETYKGSDSGDGDGDGDDSFNDYEDDCVINKICKYGIKSPSFNNYIDTTVGDRLNTTEGITDERKFFVLKNYKYDNIYKNIVNVKIGDIIQGRSFIHNNGVENGLYTAKNVTLKILGFHKIGKDAKGKEVFESKAISDNNGNFHITQSISASNILVGSKTIKDDAIVHSIDGKKFNLQFTADNSYVKSVSVFKDRVAPKINSSKLVSKNGNNIGSVKASKEDTFYLYTAFRVVDVNAHDYDLSVNETVENKLVYDKNKGYVTQKNLKISSANKLVYRLAIENDSSSITAATGTKIYKEYDKNKLKITWMSPECTNNTNYSKDKGRITCSGIDLNPGAKYTFDILAKIKDGARGKIYGSSEIISDNDIDKSNNKSATVVNIINTKYNLKINETVENRLVYNNNKGKVTQRNLNIAKKSEIIYRLSIENDSSSITASTGTKIYKEYNKNKLKITWMSPECTNNTNYSKDKGRITCSGIELNPKETYFFDILVKIKDGTRGKVYGSSEIVSDNDIDKSNNKSTTTLFIE